MKYYFKSEVEYFIEAESLEEAKEILNTKIDDKIIVTDVFENMVFKGMSCINCGIILGLDEEKESGYCCQCRR